MIYDWFRSKVNQSLRSNKTYFTSVHPSQCKQPLSSLIDDKGKEKDGEINNVNDGGKVDLMSFVSNIKKKIALQNIIERCSANA